MTRALAALVLLAVAGGNTSSPPRETGTFRVTSYCLSGVTRSGEWTRPGTVATDPNVVPLWSIVTIEGLPGVYTALDTGGGVKGNHIDLWQASCSAALEWGSQTRRVTWTPPGRAPMPDPEPEFTPEQIESQNADFDAFQDKLAEDPGMAAYLERRRALLGRRWPTRSAEGRYTILDGQFRATVNARLEQETSHE